MQAPRNSEKDLIAVNLLSEYIARASLQKLIPELSPNTIERIVAKEVGFDFSDFNHLFDGFSEESKIRYLKMAEINPEYANAKPYTLILDVTSSSPEIKRLRRHMSIPTNSR